MAGALEWIVSAGLWLIGSAIALTALAGIAWCIAGDRARGRRRCPRCWHDLSATTGMTCGECGFVARRDADLMRTRRRIGLAASLSACLFAAAIAVRLQHSGESLWSLVPARAPVALLPHLPPAGAPPAPQDLADSLKAMLLGGVREELLGRIARGELSRSAVSAVADACCAGHDGARPGTRAWLGAYGDIVAMWLSTGESAYASKPFREARFAGTSPTRAELEALTAEQDARRLDVRPISERLIALPPIVTLEPVPAAEGAPCIIWLDIRGFLMEGGEVRVRLVPAEGALDAIGGETAGPAGALADTDAHPASDRSLKGRDPEPSLRSHADRWIRWVPSGSGASRMPVVLGRHPLARDPGTQASAPVRVKVDVAWRHAPDAPWSSSSFVHESASEAAGPRVGTGQGGQPAGNEPAPTSDPEPGDGSPRGVSGADLDAAVTRAFEDGVVLWQHGDFPAAIRFDASATSGESFKGVAIGLVIDLLEDGVVRRRTRIWWPGGDPMAGARAGWEPPEEDIDALRRLARDPDGADARWSMRVRSDADLARRATSAERPAYWHGEFVLPIRARPRDEAAPPRRFTFADAPTDAPPRTQGHESPDTPNAPMPIPSRP
jgi:hypothetical protein